MTSLKIARFLGGILLRSGLFGKGGFVESWALKSLESAESMEFLESAVLESGILESRFLLH
ncbi:hypothetical protein [Helicobacter sp. 16-1353]|uniref:hypothetical protein n=1 Tax=Helicobacter sp. 16-1353 TaxID=2004996 RepID=UPI00215D4B73|nr:hypothetical protein [Helicobacter sp. 16-1353]